MRDTGRKKQAEFTKAVSDHNKDINKVEERSEINKKDGGTVETAGNEIKLEGTQEGASEINSKLQSALKKVKDTHKDIIKKDMNEKSSEIKTVEGDLKNRQSATESDKKKIQDKSGSLKGEAAADTKSIMKQAMDQAQKDVEFLKETEKSEKTQRERGENKMKDDSKELDSFKIGD